MVTVPYFLPTVPALKKNPVFLYSSDRFQKPYPFEADIVVDVDSVFEKKVSALTALVSQTFEESTRARILEAAFTCVQQLGLGRTSMSDVARTLVTRLGKGSNSEPVAPGATCDTREKMVST